MRLFVLACVAIAIFLPVSAQATESNWPITTDAAISRVRDIDIVGINLNMSISEILQKMKERGYSSHCGNTSCEFSKFNGASNASIKFRRMSPYKYRPDEINYNTNTSMTVCKEILENVCGDVAQKPCRIREDIIAVSLNQQQPDSEGWRYMLRVELNTARRSCMIRASQKWLPQ